MSCYSIYCRTLWFARVTFHCYPWCRFWRSFLEMANNAKHLWTLEQCWNNENYHNVNEILSYRLRFFKWASFSMIFFLRFPQFFLQFFLFFFSSVFYVLFYLILFTFVDCQFFFFSLLLLSLFCLCIFLSFCCYCCVDSQNAKIDIYVFTNGEYTRKEEPNNEEKLYSKIHFTCLVIFIQLLYLSL